MSHKEKHLKKTGGRKFKSGRKKPKFLRSEQTFKTEKVEGVGSVGLWHFV